MEEKVGYAGLFCAAGVAFPLFFRILAKHSQYHIGFLSPLITVVWHAFSASIIRFI
jgi:hypothetical protein